MQAEQIVLLVEDNDDDAELLLMEFKRARLSNAIVRVRDGLEALDYLFGRGNYSDRASASLPAMVLLDLNLPRLGGLDVLTAIRGSDRAKHLPVVVLTSSAEERDRLASSRPLATSYARKPLDFDQLAAAARELGLNCLVLNRSIPG